MLIFVATILLLIFVLWLIYSAIKANNAGKEAREVLNPHIIMYGLSFISGISAFTFFLSIDISKPFKILVSIILGMTIIFIANWMQKRSSTEDYEA